MWVKRKISQIPKYIGKNRQKDGKVAVKLQITISDGVKIPNLP